MHLTDLMRKTVRNIQSFILQQKTEHMKESSQETVLQPSKDTSNFLAEMKRKNICEESSFGVFKLQKVIASRDLLQIRTQRSNNIRVVELS